MKRKHIIVILLALALVGCILAFALFYEQGKVQTDATAESAIPTEDPIDVTTEFFNNWLKLEQGTTTEVTLESLLTSPRLNAALQAKLSAAVNDTPDPVLCQTTIPERMGAKLLYAQERNAQVMMLARGLETKSPFQTIVTLAAVDGQWQMTDISCAQGEVAPEKAFDFEREGYLLKAVPPPLNPDQWHLVYEENGKQGHTVPLTVTAESI